MDLKPRTAQLDTSKVWKNPDTRRVEPFDQSKLMPTDEEAQALIVAGRYFNRTLDYADQALMSVSRSERKSLNDYRNHLMIAFSATQTARGIRARLLGVHPALIETPADDAAPDYRLEGVELAPPRPA